MAGYPSGWIFEIQIHMSKGSATSLMGLWTVEDDLMADNVLLNIAGSDVYLDANYTIPLTLGTDITPYATIRDFTSSSGGTLTVYKKSTPLLFTWGTDATLPSGITNGKAYFATTNNYPTTASSASKANEAFIYFDKDGKRYKVIAQRALQDTRGNDIDKYYFAQVTNNNSNNLIFKDASNGSTGSRGSVPIITSLGVTSTCDTSSVGVQIRANGFASEIDYLPVATYGQAGILTAEDQLIGGNKTFMCGQFQIICGDMDNGPLSAFLETPESEVMVVGDAATGQVYVNGAISGMGVGSFTMPNLNALDSITGKCGLQIIDENTVAAGLQANYISLYASDTIRLDTPEDIRLYADHCEIAAETTIFSVGSVSISDSTLATTDSAALFVTGGTTTRNLIITDATDSTSSTTGVIQAAGGAYIAKQLRVGTNATISQALTVGRNVTLNNSESSSAHYTTTIKGATTISNTLTVGSTFKSSANVILNDSETSTTDTYTTTVKGKSTFQKRASFSDGIDITGNLTVSGDGSFNGDIYASGGEIYIGASGDRAKLSYDSSTDTLTVSFAVS